MRPALAEIAELKSIAQQDGIEELKPWMQPIILRS